jgi:hypothetical protein
MDVGAFAGFIEVTSAWPKLLVAPVWEATFQSFVDGTYGALPFRTDWFCSLLANAADDA